MVTPTPSPVPNPTRQLLANLWERNLPLLLERLAELDRAAASAAAHTLTPEARHSAAAIAHKLSGTLGMFGYPQGTELARSLEVLLETPGPLDAIALRDLTAALRESLSL
jgi:HPt (histidine-containing phosphotransfer) domain-containing protein